MEAALLGVFMLSASLFALLLEYPGSPVHRTLGSAFLRHALLGLGMGCVIAGIVYSPWGKRSGAHINPAVTLSFWRAGNIKAWDAFFYTLAQFAGACLTVLLLKFVVGTPYAHPKVMYVVTKPGPMGAGGAFVAEALISFLLMLVTLIAINSQKLEKLTGLFSGILIALYLTFEVTLSGMSLNPARSFGSAIVSRYWEAYWVYLLAPPLAMLLAAETYRWLRQRQRSACAKLHPHNAECCPFCDHKESPVYPDDKQNKEQN